MARSFCAEYNEPRASNRSARQGANHDTQGPRCTYTDMLGLLPSRVTLGCSRSSGVVPRPRICPGKTRAAYCVPCPGPRLAIGTLKSLRAPLLLLTHLCCSARTEPGELTLEASQDVSIENCDVRVTNVATDTTTVEFRCDPYDSQVASRGERGKATQPLTSVNLRVGDCVRWSSAYFCLARSTPGKDATFQRSYSTDDAPWILRQER